MLGQHPEMYGFPELNLFVTDTVGELLKLDSVTIEAAGRPGANYTPGLVRAVAQLHFGEQTEDTATRALAWLMDRVDWSTGRMFNHLLNTVHPRIGIDKSPRTALSTLALSRAMEFCPGSMFLHLTRHPVATLRSMARRRPPAQIPDAEFARFAVQLWCSVQQTIMTAAEVGPASRFLRVRGEDLLNNPAAELFGIAHWLGIRDDPAALEEMLHPERSPYARIGPWPSDGDQDPGFLSSPLLRAADTSSLLALPEEWRLCNEDKANVLTTARSLGYE